MVIYDFSYSDIFEHAVDSRAKTSLTLVGLVCYYGLHYSLFFYHSTKKAWIYFEDSIVTEMGNFWQPVKQKIVRGKHQPCMVMVEIVFK